MGSLDCTVIGDIMIDINIRALGKHREFFIGGTSYCDFAKVELAGSGNVAVGLSSLGGKVAFVGKAGDDFFGELYIQNLNEKGVISKIFLDRDCPTGLVIVFADGSERSFLVFRGANDKLSIGEIEKSLNIISESKCAYFSGYSLVNDPQKSAVFRAIELARKFKVRIIFDPGAYNLVISNRQLFTKLLDLCDVFSPNLNEAEALTNTTDMNDIINRLRNKVPLTALKLGREGCILINRTNIVKVPGFNVESLDPTGAGDAFTAALIYGLTHRLSLKSTGQLANWYAAKIVTHFGSRSYPSKPEIDYFLQKLRESA
jgi:sugar/nucleoside kinase (ribokinase family)